MVLKGTKRAIRSGNTLRNIKGCDAIALKSEHAVIVRSSTESCSLEQSADDNYLSADGVVFSLNKKGRWLLPEVIEENIISTSDGEQRVQLSIQHRHAINRQGNCLRSITNDQSDMFYAPQRKKARRKTYCNGLMVQNNGRGRQTKDLRKKKIISTRKDIALRNLAAGKADDIQDVVDKEGRCEAAAAETPQVRYDVVYPLPATSALRYHPKFASYPVPANGIEDRLHRTAGLKHAGTGTKHRCRQDYYQDYSIDDYYEDEEEGEYADDFIDDGPVGEQSRKCCWTRLFSEFIEAAEQAMEAGQPSKQTSQIPVQTAREIKCDKRQKVRTHIAAERGQELSKICEDGSSEQDSFKTGDISGSKSSQVRTIIFKPSIRKPVRVILPASEVSREVLLRDHGTCYMEGECIPRRFAIDITHRLQNALRRVKTFQHVYLPSLDLTAFVVFTFGAYSSDETFVDNNDESVVYHVCLNIKLRGFKSAIATLYDLMPCANVEEILLRVINYVTTLDSNLLNSWVPEVQLCSNLDQGKRTDFRFVCQTNSWKVFFVRLPVFPSSESDLHGLDFSELQESRLLRELARSGIRLQSDSQTKDAENLQSKSDTFHTSLDLIPELCGICCEDISNKESGSMQATALRSCRHWFCNACWEIYLLTTSQDGGGCGRLGLQCPQNGCRAEVDLVTMLAVLRVFKVQALQRRRLDLQVTGAGLSKWCPNPICGRIILLPDKDYMKKEDNHTQPTPGTVEPTSLTCKCSTQLCFKCLQTAHWPATCRELATYREQLIRRGELLPRSDDCRLAVHGKNCPKCGAFIEKNGGCQHMTCVCGHQFCWTCRLSSYNPTTNVYHVCDGRSHSDRVGTTKIFIRHIKSSRPEGTTEWLEYAVGQRRKQSAGEVRTLCKAADQLRKNLQVLANKGVDIGFQAQPGVEACDLVMESVSACVGWVSQGHETDSNQVSKSRSQSTGAAFGKTQQRHLPMDTFLLPTRQTISVHVTRITMEMAKLKIELHHVAEYTAVVLWSHDQNNTTVLAGKGQLAGANLYMDVLGRITAICSSLDSLLRTESVCELRKVLPWFRRLQTETEETLAELARLSNRRHNES